MTENDADMQGFLLGEVKFFDANRGFGFILPDHGKGDVFVHASVCPDIKNEIADGQRIAFKSIHTRQGLRATDVALISNYEEQAR